MKKKLSRTRQRLFDDVADIISRSPGATYYSTLATLVTKQLGSSEITGEALQLAEELGDEVSEALLRIRSRNAL